MHRFNKNIDKTPYALIRVMDMQQRQEILFQREKIEKDLVTNPRPTHFSDNCTHKVISSSDDSEKDDGLQRLRQDGKRRQAACFPVGTSRKA